MFAMSADEIVGVDHYRRERCRQLRQLELQKQNALPLEKADSPPDHSSSSPNLLNLVRDQEKARKVLAIGKTASLSLPRIQNNNNILLSCRAAESDPGSPPVSLNNLSLCKSQALVNFKQLEKLHFLIPDRLAYVSLSLDEISNLKEDTRGLNISVISSYLHKEYVPLCADFGPVALNVVHRFCQVLKIRFNMR